MRPMSVNRISKLAALIALTAIAASCAGSNNPAAPTVPAPAAAATVSNVRVTSVVSSSTSYQLTAIATSSDGTSQDVTRSATWLSSNTQFATVSTAGDVSVVGTGDVDLGATFKGIAGAIRLSVVRPAVFTLRGVVREAGVGGLPVGGARVQILSGNNDHAFSDDFGEFMLAGITAGETIIEVTRPGYASWSNEIVITGNSTLNVTLSPLAE
jgi:hypothetical protein